MTEKKWTVGERSFFSKSEYEAALRDQKKVEMLKGKTDFSREESIMALYRTIKTRNFGFETVIGRDFDDEVYEIVTSIKNGTFQQEKNTKSQGVRKVKKNAVKKEKTKRKPAKETDLDKNIKVYTKGEYRIRLLIKNIMLLAALACLLYFGYYCYMTVRTNNDARRLAALKENDNLNAMMESEVVVNKDTEEERVFVLLDEYKTLYNKNKNLIGWLKIDDTIIDYPVTQAKDNEYYLDHNMNQEYDKNGTLFMDKDCSITKPSTNYIIYGHHMKSGKMFGDLDKYKSESYYKEHPTIQFDTIYEKGVYEVMYVFNSRIYYEDEIVFKYYQFIDAVSEQEFASNMLEMEKMSLYDTGVRAEYGDQLLTLSTCDYGETDARFVVVAKKVS